MKYIRSKFGREGCINCTNHRKRPFVSKLLTFWPWNFLKNIVQATRRWVVRSKVSNSGNGCCFLPHPKLPHWLWFLHSEMVGTYWPSLGIKWVRCKPKSWPVSSAQVIMHSKMFPLLWRLQWNEQQKVKAVRVSGTDMYGKEWAGCSADLCSGVGWRLVSFGIWCELLTAWSVGMLELWRWRQ